MVTVRGGKVAKMKSAAANRIAAGTANAIQYQNLARLSPDQRKAARAGGGTHVLSVMGRLHSHSRLKNQDSGTNDRRKNQLASLLCDEAPARHTIGPRGNMSVVLHAD
jgi:hypothetical protein